MGQKYTTTSISGYNSSPPVDDGTQSEANKVKWATHKTKLGDPIKDQVATIDTKLVAMADVGPDAKTANYTTVAGDHQKTIEVTTAGVTITLLAVASAPTGYTVTIKNASGGVISVDATASETIDGSTGVISMANDNSMTVQLNNAETGYNKLVIPQAEITPDTEIYKGVATGTDTITTSATPVLSAYADGLIIVVKAAGANTVINPTINVDSLGAKTIKREGNVDLEIGDIAGADHELLLKYNLSNDVFELLNPKIAPARNGYIYGLTLSNNGTDAEHDIDIATGECSDSTGVYTMSLTSAMTKQIDVTWAAGTAAGGLFTGTVAADTWYHVFVIRNDTTGAIDAGFDTSVTAANIPTGYTSYRRIGSVLTDATSNILSFVQVGDYFRWTDIVLDYNAAFSTTTTTVTLSVPTGVRCMAKVGYYFRDDLVGQVRARLFETDVTDAAIDTANANIGGGDGDGGAIPQFNGELHLLTDTSSQIKGRASATLTDSDIWVIGWEDFRGKQ